MSQLIAPRREHRGPVWNLINSILAKLPDGAFIWLGGKKCSQCSLPATLFRKHALFFFPYANKLLVGAGPRYRPVNARSLGVRFQLTLAVMMRRPDHFHDAEAIANLGYDEHGYPGGDPSEVATHRIFRIRKVIQPDSREGPFIFSKRFLDLSECPASDGTGQPRFGVSKWPEPGHRGAMRRFL